jgi:methyltransferase family protein
MLESSRRLIEERLGPQDRVLDVGGWAQPLERADWVIDLMPYDTRGLYGYDKETATERFTRDTWVEHDICSREPWPFADDQFDFAVCSHTLEDVRDPVWVCEELRRVARAGYIEVPSRLEEQAWGVQGNFVGWTHHRWLIDVTDRRIDFTLKLHEIHGRAQWYFPNEFLRKLDERARVQCMWWEGGFEASERMLMSAEEADAYLSGFVNGNGKSAAAVDGSRPLRRLRALRRRLRRAAA